MILHLSRKLLSVEVLGPVLVILALQMLAYGISSSLPGTEINDLFTICLIAAALGWILSRSRWNGWVAASLIAILGLIGIWIVGSRLALPLLDLGKVIASLAPQIIPSLQEKMPVDTRLVAEAWSVIVQASSALLERWQAWLIHVLRKNTVNDALIRNMIWSFVIWCLAAWTGWYAARRNAVLAFLPGITLMAVVLSYSEYRIYSLWIMLILMLLLMGMWNYKNHTTQWERRRVDYSDSIVYDNAQAVVFLALLVGTIAFSTPSLSWRELRDAWQNRNKNEAAEVLGIRKESVPVKPKAVQEPTLPRQHLLTEGFAQSQELVMTIRTGELPPGSYPSIAVSAPRHYWRSTIYDEYMGTGWVTTTTTPQKYRSNTPLIPGLLEGYQPLHLDVKLEQPEGKLFWSGLLYSASVPVRADWRVRPEANLFADQTALLQSDIFLAAAGTKAYEAEAYVPHAPVDQLRAASTEYPQEIRLRYLRLPPELPARVHELAKEITQGIDNPYDKAKAIERYLRNTYPYDLNVPAPPTDQDVTDYFLFDLKRGYCDYYATAMVVLARASGLPARFVSGYAPGSYDATSAQYIVRELNAHSWAEVYFPEIGWIEFEATASQPEIERVQQESIQPASVPSSTPTQKILFKIRGTGILYWISPLLILLFSIVAYFTVLEKIWVLSRSPSSAIAYLYKKFYRLGRPLAGERTRAETASEFTSKLIHEMEKIDQRSRSIRPSQDFRVRTLQFTRTYLLSLFSDHPVEKEDARQAFALWKLLRRQLWIARLKNKLHRQAT